jgi:hypothetical protein
VSSDTYILDTNVFLDAANNYYAFDRVPAFWEWLEARFNDGAVRTITMAKDEVDFPPEVAEWLNERTQRPPNRRIEPRDPGRVRQDGGVARVTAIRRGAHCKLHE